MSQPDLYQYRSLFRSQKIALSEADQALLANLPRLALKTRSIDFAEVLLDLLRAHPEHKNIARVCMVKRLGLANHIAVISSQNLDKQPANNMSAGYSCFIGDKGSLFSLSPGTSRSYQSANNIVADFESRGRLPQRSIKLIADMQFASGMALPSFDHHQRLIGALFFNSFDKQLFQRAADCTLLSAIEIHAKSHILQQSSEWLHVYENLPLQWNAQSFNANCLTECLHTIDSQLRLDINSQVSPFLISHGNLASLIHQIMRHANTSSLRLRTDKAGASVAFMLEDLKLKTLDQSVMTSWAKSIGYRLVPLDSGLLIEVTYEPVVDDDVTYSTILSDGNMKTTMTQNSLQDNAVTKNALHDDFTDIFGTGSDNDLMMAIVVNYLTGDLSDSTEEAAGQHLAVQCHQAKVSGISLYQAGIFMHILEGRRGCLHSLAQQWSSLTTFGSTRYLLVQAIDQAQFTAWHLQSVGNVSQQTNLINEVLSLNLSHKASLAEMAIKLARNYFEQQV